MTILPSSPALPTIKTIALVLEIELVRAPTERCFEGGDNDAVERCDVDGRAVGAGGGKDRRVVGGGFGAPEGAAGHGWWGGFGGEVWGWEGLGWDVHLARDEGAAEGVA